MSTRPSRVVGGGFKLEEASSRDATQKSYFKFGSFLDASLQD